MIIANLDGFPVEVNPEACRMYGYSRDEFLDLHPRVLSPQNLEVVRAGGTLQEQAVNHRKDGTSIHVEGRAKAFTYRGKPHILTVVRDITERVHAYEVLEQRVEERTRELSTLLDVSRHVTSTLELQPLLDLILEQVRTVVDYSGAAIFELRDDRVLTLARRSPGPDPHAGPDHYPANEVRPLLDVLLRGEPIIIEDVRGDTPMAAAYRVSVGEYLETDLDFERSWMGIPMSLKDRIMGVLALSSVETGFFTLHHAELALAIAQQAAVAIENARLYERAQELAALEERQRLARELHDSVSQALFGIGLGARTARALVDRDPGQAAQSIDYVLSLAQGGMAEMRALIFELRPESLETEGLIAALQKQAEATSARYEIPVRSSLCAEPAAPLPVKEALYRIAQEALHNTVKHAQAGSIELSLVREERDVVLEVRDDGRGFDPGGSFPGHLGLHSMKERAARHGGVVGVESALGRGTSVRARIPLAVET